MAYARDGGRLLVFGTNGGGHRHPDWYRNLVADPQVTIEIRENGAIRTHAARAVPLEGAERDHFHEVRTRHDPARVAALGAQLRRHHDDLRARLRRLRADPTATCATTAWRSATPCGVHHLREDGAFTAFEDHDPALAPVPARLREEHRAVAGVIAQIAAPANAPERLRPEPDRLEEQLEAHFAYEEQHIG